MSRNKKSKTISKLKKEVWKWFSLFIRLRGADKNKYNICCTCGKKKYYKELQAGHFLSGRHNVVLFHEDLTNPQCYSCNFFLGGNPRAYDAFMRKKYGDVKVQEFDKLSKGRAENKTFTEKELLQMIDKYKTIVGNYLTFSKK